MNSLLITTDRHSHHNEEAIEEEEIVLPAKNIYLACENIPEGYDAIRIALDGRIKADLSWDRQRALAEKYIEQGLRIFWEIDLGLFDKLDQPLSSKPQFLSLTLSLEHFRDTLWKSFRQHTVGVCLYRGSLDFNNVFCCDACSEYLDLLSQCLPDTIPLHLMFDVATIVDNYRCAQLLSKGRYLRFTIAVKGLSTGQLLGGDLEWTEGHLRSRSIDRPTLGMCLPETPCSDNFRKSMEKLCLQGTPFRVIPSSFLTAEWDGLDELIVDRQSVDTLLQRKLEGFRAAGGNIVYA